MKKLFINKPAVKQSLLFTTVVALSIWVGSNPISLQHEKLSVPVTTSTTIPNNSSQQIQPQVYWLRSNQNKLTLVAKLLPSNTSGSTPQQVLTTAIQKLLSAQPRDDLTSTIPKGTKLLSLQVRADGVHVDLSPEFRSGGGSTSMIYRVAQVIYTSTSLDPNQKVFISVGGQSIDSNHPLGGEGLILQQPTTRAQFAADFL
ncbi:GerMN domain-containing protein [Chamaesiphon sp. VAR_48_metabat_135_sub]|uniref:GerMN domain-containing protein n=1 Tax=Chamaesiphon sp. VAR_48_metabat_135_sub TaxID=2964699 RepID=UPI00286A1904|nr:GerMN domain-containing protein [Chamaesiphon sp. VAR_48_metabat_135_sub]